MVKTKNKIKDKSKKTKVKYMNKKSKFFSLSFQDFAKGSIVAILTGLMTFLSGELQSDVTFTFKQVLLSAVIALLAYLIKNLFTNSNDTVLKSEPKS